MSDATLTLRCPTKGHTLAEVIYEQGKPFGFVRESATYITNDPYRLGAPKTFVTRWDLLEEYPDRTQIMASCRCGKRLISLATLLDLVKSGQRGKTLTKAALI
jgi:hypothetical protein